MCCTVVSSSVSVSAANDVVFVLDGENIVSNHSVTRCEGESLWIGCGYRETVRASDLSLRYISVTPPQTLPLTHRTAISFFNVLSYKLSGFRATGDKRYQCVWKNFQYNVTIHFTRK